MTQSGSRFREFFGDFKKNRLQSISGLFVCDFIRKGFFMHLKARISPGLFISGLLVSLITLSLLPFYSHAQTSSSTLGSSDDETQELSYEDLLGRLKTHKSKIKKEQYHPYDDLFIHTSLGLVSSFSTFNWQNKSYSWQQNGINLGLGADLFSRLWYTEGVFRNYGVSSSSGQELTLRQLDFRIGYKDELQNPFKYHLGFGLSTRSLKITNIYTRASAEETTPAMLLYGRLMAQPNPNVSLGLDVTGRTPFVSSGVDRGSVEIGLLTVLSL